MGPGAGPDATDERRALLPNLPSINVLDRQTSERAHALAAILLSKKVARAIWPLRILGIPPKMVFARRERRALISSLRTTQEESGSTVCILRRVVVVLRSRNLAQWQWWQGLRKSGVVIRGSGKLKSSDPLEREVSLCERRRELLRVPWVSFPLSVLCGSSCCDCDTVWRCRIEDMCPLS